MSSRLWVPVASGPLASYAAGYGSWLAGKGYSRWTVSHRLRQLELLSRWLEREGLSAGELTPARVEEFLAGAASGGLLLVAVDAEHGAAACVPTRVGGRAGGGDGGCGG